MDVRARCELGSVGYPVLLCGPYALVRRLRSVTVVSVKAQSVGYGAVHGLGRTPHTPDAGSSSGSMSMIGVVFSIIQSAHPYVCAAHLYKDSVGKPVVAQGVTLLPCFQPFCLMHPPITDAYCRLPTAPSWRHVSVTQASSLPTPSAWPWWVARLLHWAALDKAVEGRALYLGDCSIILWLAWLLKDKHFSNRQSFQAQLFAKSTVWPVVKCI